MIGLGVRSIIVHIESAAALGKDSDSVASWRLRPFLEVSEDLLAEDLLAKYLLLLLLPMPLPEVLFEVEPLEPIPKELELADPLPEAADPVPDWESSCSKRSKSSLEAEWLSLFPLSSAASAHLTSDWFSALAPS